MSVSTLKKKIFPNISFGVTVLLFCLCPLVSLPYIISGCYKNDKKYYLLASLFMGLGALILFLPIADQYRHAIDFYKLKGQSWDVYYLLAIANGQIDFFVNGLLFLTNKYNLPFGINRAILTTICSYLFLLLYDLYCKEHIYSDNDKKWILWLIFLIFPIGAICTGMRFASGICLVIYVFSRWTIFNKKNISDYIILFIAIFTHTGCIIPICLYIICLFIPNRISGFNFVCLMLIALLFASSFYLILSYLPLPEVLSSYTEKYTQGKFADSDYITSGSNFIGLLQIYIGLYGKLFVILFLILKSYKYNINSKYLYALVVFYLLTLNMFSLNGRIGLIITIYGSLQIIKFWKGQLRHVTIAILLITLFLQLFSWRYIKYYRVEYFFTPIIFALEGDHDERWIEANVNEEGTIKDYW